MMPEEERVEKKETERTGDKGHAWWRESNEKKGMKR